MRLLGVLALAAPVAIGALSLFAPDALVSWIDGGARSILAAIGAGAIGVSLTALVVATHFRYRFVRVVKAAERIAGGDYTVQVAPRPGLEGRLAAAVNVISGALADTHDKATYDRLTGVANRQALLAELVSEVVRASRYDRPLSVAFVDIDHFKAVNDSYGHGVGDEVLRGVAQTLSVNLRTTDMIGRYGGEEFMLILTETDVEEAAVLSEKLRTLVQRERFVVEGGTEISVTISIGIAGGIGNNLRTENLIRDADAAMYSAKSLGRNQTYIFSEPDDDNRVPRAPISAAGRTRALQIGQQARDAATEALTSVLLPLPHYRGQPSALIATIVVSMARQLNLPDADVDRLRIAALLHDVGKVAVPQEILEKPSALTSAEWRTVVQHPRIGQVILEQASALKDAVPIILHHHERFAGHGYPYGLRANEIPLGARIVAVADAYDAMVTDRPYKRAISHEQAIAELRRHSGTQFDPELIDYFCDLYGSRPPVPDPGVLSMIGANTASRGAAIMVPDAVPGRAVRRRRRTDEDVAGDATPHGVSQTMAPDGALGVLAASPEPSSPRRRHEPGVGSPVTSLPGPGAPRPGRSESATS
jgi:diguanylate cyclase (GGDEF)-like protein/putative nucleotidyltransferase with HDIG domain